MNKPPKKIITFLIIVFLALLILQGINLFRRTFIDWYILLIPAVLAPMVALPIRKRFTGESETLQAAFMTYVYLSPASFYMFLALNFYFGDNRAFAQDFDIVKKGEAFGGRGKSTPYLIITFNGKEKQIFLDRNEQKRLAQSNQVQINFEQGMLGYYVINEYKLK